MLIFIDFEASSLFPDSWPIEIGLARIVSGGQIVSHGRLIRPHPTWSEAAWSAESAAVHGISRAALEDADPAVEIARWTIGMTRDARLVSDAPEFDQRWMDRLLATLPDAPSPRIRDFDGLVWRRFNRDGPVSPATRAIYRNLERPGAAHRAEADARRLADAWAAGLTARRG